MTNHQKFNKMDAIKKIYQKPRASKDIGQDYANTASALGDKTFALTLQREAMEKTQTEIDNITDRLRELKGEYDSAMAAEKEKSEETTDTPPPITTTEQPTVTQ